MDKAIASYIVMPPVQTQVLHNEHQYNIPSYLKMTIQYSLLTEHEKKIVTFT